MIEVHEAVFYRLEIDLFPGTVVTCLFRHGLPGLTPSQRTQIVRQYALCRTGHTAALRQLYVTGSM